MPDPQAGSRPDHTNRLADETSPYLLQHAHNPVDWYAWGEPALAAARAQGRPIFLSIGYAACHWCHVMERESFEDEATAAQLNRDFVAIKIDREERPDLDQLYMGAVQAMTGGGGWPMSVFLTPDGRPFYGGTYFPPSPTHGLPAFRDVLSGVRRAWDEQREEVEQAGARLVAALVEQQLPVGRGVDPGRGVLDDAVAGIERSFDARNGGWGGAPKFPQPMTIEFLLRRASGGDERALAVGRRTLDAMADGGVHDQLGGGFHRYATDARWLVPHFEQMLYDNAQLARVYVHAWQLTGEPRYADVARATLGFIRDRLGTAEGGFAASLDADTDGVEGATFTWTLDEIRAALADVEPGTVELVEAAYGVTRDGNWEGRTILSRVAADDALGTRFGLSTAEAADRLAVARTRLLEARDRRPQPARDTKVLAAWNGLAIAAFADAALAFEADRDDLLATASRAADAVVAGLLGPDGRLGRSWKDGRASADGVLEDYANLAEGLLSLYEASGDERWFTTARALADGMLGRFADPDGGFFDTASDAEALVARPRDPQDNATPSGGSAAALALVRLAALTGERRDREAAEAAIRGVVPYLDRHPTSFAWWLVAADFALADVVELAVVGPPDDPATRRLLAPALAGFRPHRVLALSADPATSAVPLLADRVALDDRPTAYLCRDFACRRPVTEPTDLAALLEDRASG
jgi:uncharacterized protein YyaL (SSP411 family)